MEASTYPPIRKIEDRLIKKSMMEKGQPRIDCENRQTVKYKDKSVLLMSE